MARVLIVDDEPNVRRVLASILRPGGHETTEASGVEEACRKLAASEFDLILTDQRMTDGDGLAVLRASLEHDPAVPVVFLTAYATVELAVAAMREGAFDFITKPFEPQTVLAVVRRGCERTELLRENERLRGQVRRLAGPDELIGKSRAMSELRELIGRVGPTGATVLVMGETGTGKELVARAIHRASPRADRPFVAVNCAGFTESLLESELFGHERGAFTGADRSRAGVFEAAHRGTLFLDEAGEMPLALQAKLLRVLTNGEVVRVGSTVPRSTDVRIVAATNRNLDGLVRDGRFREDLFYRLAVVPIVVPPLRQRPDDIPVLVEHFLTRVASELNAPRRALSPSALERLLAYDFPGNIRELRNLVERATILARGHLIEAEDLPVHPASPAGEGGRQRSEKEARTAWLDSLPDLIDLRGTLAAAERALIARALDAAAGVQADAARRLGVSRSLLGYKLKALEQADHEIE